MLPPLETMFPLRRGLRDLLAAARKKDAERVARTLVLTENDVASIATSAPLLGYRHALKTAEIIPPDAMYTREQQRAFWANPRGPEAKVFLRKLEHVFTRRKQIFIHLLERNREWHLFHFTPQELILPAGRGNHWKLGPHLHYVSHLWTGLSAGRAITTIETGAHVSDLHIQVAPDKDTQQQHRPPPQGRGLDQLRRQRRGK